MAPKLGVDKFPADVSKMHFKAMWWNPYIIQSEGTEEPLETAQQSPITHWPTGIFQLLICFTTVTVNQYVGCFYSI